MNIHGYILLDEDLCTQIDVDIRQCQQMFQPATAQASLASGILLYIQSSDACAFNMMDSDSYSTSMIRMYIHSVYVPISSLVPRLFF